MKPLRNITSGETGQAMPEYALVMALIGVALFGALTFLQGQITGLFTQVGSLL
jgi:Flp pilus assembly pilin Flp